MSLLIVTILKKTYEKKV